jgi:YD repeat-containing protein
MQTSSTGTFRSSGSVSKRRFGTIGASSLLIASALLSAGCSSDAAQPSGSERSVNVPLGTSRAALVTSSVLQAVGDTYIRNAFPNQNEGSSPTLSVQIGGPHRSIVYFDPAVIRATALGQTLISAQVELTIEANGRNWGPGRSISIHSMRQASTESQATWSCAMDSNVANTLVDCTGATAWNMSATNGTLPFASQATSSSLINNSLTGVVSLDVTSDVAAIVAGTDAGLGWLIKKVNETLSGTVSFASRETGSGPRLRLWLDAPSCTPSAQNDTSCDGADDDCDGDVDEDYVTVSTSCGVGACSSAGLTSCLDGLETDNCQPGAPASGDQTCDGVDDDCNGVADQDYVQLATSCGLGACQASGGTSCVGGQVTDSCSPGLPASADATCDGLDENCNGLADEGYAPLTTLCGVGACGAVGATTCVIGEVLDTCQAGAPAASDASCDGTDDDCDGVADEDYASLTTSCGVGACGASGATSCADGAVADSCAPGTPAALDASCDGLDDDCDGAADEDYAALTTSCGVGACSASGATSCSGSSVVDSCAPNTPAALDSSCDGSDDDCDGVADEDFAPTCVGPVARSCVSGAFHDVQCGDANACNGLETCSGLAVCQPGTPPELDDGDPCTLDECEPALGVLHPLVAAGTACGAYRECNATGECLSLLPPDPAEVAPTLPAGSVAFFESVRFIFDGPSPIQTLVAPGTLQPRSAAVLRGRLLNEADEPLPGAVVRVHGHPEFGQTLTRFDGEYDLVVNGGQFLTLEFAHVGYLDAQRTLNVPWRDYAFVDDLGLVPPDTSSSELEFPAATAQVHRAATTEDERGVRTATLYLPSGTEAELVLLDGSSIPVPSLSLRATEFSVGLSGPLRLPAELAPTAAFNYALELSADEALAVDAERVELSQSASLYLENFLDLPIGSTLPAGAYDRDLAMWQGADSGRVVQIVDISSGLAELDLDGTGNAAGAAALSAIGVTVEERETLAALYDPGTALWRVQVQHLAPFDLSLPYRTDSGVGATTAVPPSSPTVQPSQVLASSLPIAGTGFTLHYRSDRVPGYKVAQILDIPTTGPSSSSTYLGGLIEIQVAGQRHDFTLDAGAAQLTRFVWDGRDGEGRHVHGTRHADIRVGWMYPRQYVAAPDISNAYAQTSPAGAVLAADGGVDIRWQRHSRDLRRFDQRELGVAAWSLDQQHRFDPVGRALYRGDGTVSTLRAADIIERFAGMPGTPIDTGDGGSALAARLNTPRSLAVGADGAVYIGGRLSIRRVNPNTGIISTVAGGREQSNCNVAVENVPARDMCVFARKLDFGRDGALYYSDNPITGSVDTIRRLDPQTGIVSHVAGGTGACTDSGEGGPARQARICHLLSHANGPDGSIYYIDRGAAGVAPTIRKISPNGIVQTIGTGLWGSQDDSGDIAIGPDGSVYVTRPGFLQRILPTGEVQHFAGDATLLGSSGEGGPATLARFGSGGPNGVTVGSDGRVYVGDNGNALIRMVDPTGIIRRVVGATTNAISGDGGSPLLANLGPGNIRTALGPDGALYTTARTNNTLRVVRPAVRESSAGELLVPSDDGSETYRFDANGRHLDTRQTAGGTLRYSFGYDAAGRLISVSNAGQVLQIERDAGGRPTRLLAASGEQTLLETDENGYLSRMTPPLGAQVQLDYDALGRLVQRQDGTGSHDYGYDAEGRLSAP